PRRNSSTYDDDTTQSALRFLMEIDRVLKHKEERIHRTVQYGLAKLLEAQYGSGAWPQRYSGRLPAVANPQARARCPSDWPRTHPGRGHDYGMYYTLNDRVLETIVSTLLRAHEVYDQRDYLQAAVRAGEFLLRAQLPEPQPAWAQQYNLDMEPAWARTFEPPAVSSAESASAIRTLLRLYLVTGDERFFRPIPPAIDWMRRSRLANGRWSRFYELQTNRPLYCNKRYELVYTEDDLPTHYSFQGEYGIPALMKEVEHLQRVGRQRFLDQSKRPITRQALRSRLDQLEPTVRTIIKTQDPEGRWLNNHEIRMATFIRNMETLAEYLETYAVWKDSEQY
ncbi:MAG: pectate lyase, partial [Gemmatales bacterium]|nr:pectate lyase [Gemmatales bacterium]